MAEKKGSSIRFDDFVGAVHADPAAAEPSLLLSGYIGRSDNAENLRVYPDAGLGHWFEVPQADVIHSMPQADSPLGGSHLWVRATAQITPGAPKPPAVEGGGETEGSEGSEGGGGAAEAGPDTGIFNPFATTLQPTMHMGCWVTMQGCPPQGGGLGAVHPQLITQINCTQLGCTQFSCPTHPGAGCVTPIITQINCTQLGCTQFSCPTHPGAGCGGEAEGGRQPGEFITIATLPALCRPTLVCPQNTTATLCTQVTCPRTQTFACPITRTFNCPPTRICLPPTKICVTQLKCPTQLGCPDTRVCTPGAMPGGFGGQEAGAQITLMTIDTMCTHAAPCVGHTGWEGCGQQGADTTIGQTGWQGCHTIVQSAWLGCQPPIGPTGWHGCGDGGAALQGGPTGWFTCTQQPLGPTGTQGCHQPLGPTGTQGCHGGGLGAEAGQVGQTGWFTCHLVGPTGTQGCHQPLGPTGTQGCGGGGGQLGNVGPTGTQGCQPPLGPTGWQGCHQIGHTGWLGCHQPLGPTGTQGCGGGGQLGNVGPTGTQGCHGPIGVTGWQGCHQPLGPTGWQGCGVADTVRGPTAWLGCHQPVGPTGWQGCQPQGNNVSVPGNCPTVGIACMPTIPCLPPSVGCPAPHTSMMGCPNTSTC